MARSNIEIHSIIRKSLFIPEIMIRGVVEYFFYMYGGVRAEPSYNCRHYLIQVRARNRMESDRNFGNFPFRFRTLIQVVTAIVPFTICICLTSIYLFSEQSILTDHSVAIANGVLCMLITMLYGFLSRIYTTDIDSYRVERNCSPRSVEIPVLV